MCKATGRFIYYYPMFFFLFFFTVEPHLQPLSGEQLSGASANFQDGAYLDVAMNGLWGGRYEI